MGVNHQVTYQMNCRSFHHELKGINLLSIRKSAFFQQIEQIKTKTPNRMSWCFKTLRRDYILNLESNLRRWRLTQFSNSLWETPPGVTACLTATTSLVYIAPLVYIGARKWQRSCHSKGQVSVIRALQSSGAVWKSRWLSWAPRPQYCLWGHKAKLNLRHGRPGLGNLPLFCAVSPSNRYSRTVRSELNEYDPNT